MEPLTDLVVRAGAAILAVNRSAMKIDGKLDGSPVTEADLAADRIIGEGLARLAPEIPALSEERVHLAKPPYHGSFFLIDPLDGTKEFVAGRNEFTVNLALVTNGTPLLGIIGAPALGLIWRGIVGRGAERLAVERHVAAERPSRSIPASFPRPAPPGSWPSAARMATPGPKPLSRQGPARFAQMLGSAVKFGRVAEGGADIYPRLAPTSEWDVAAGHAIVTAAGGKITDGQGAALQFGSGRDGFIVPEFIAWGDPAAALTSSGRSKMRTSDSSSSSSAPNDATLRRLFQRRPARLGLPQMCAGSAAKASRFCSRPNK